MTPVQASTIPLFTGNKDPVVEAVTGSGKTLAFLIPIISRLLALEEPIPKHHIGAIIISPTRELATQIHSVLLQLLSFHPPSAAAINALNPSTSSSDTTHNQTDTDQQPPIFPASTLRIIPQLLTGGSNTTPQTSLSHFLKHSPNILIATSGRLLDLISSPHVHCPQSSFQVLVLDEADRLLQLGFKPTLSAILTRLPKQRRTGLFSASVGEAVEDIIRVGLRNPYRVNVKVRGVAGEAELKTPAALQLRCLTVSADRKLGSLLKLMASVRPLPQKTIAYLPTCASVDYISHVLQSLISHFYTKHTSEKLDVVSLHGRLTQPQRTANLTKFTASMTPTLLLTTDVAARGLDIPLVDLVVQLDPPSDPTSFLHRSGRAGRAGRKGLAIVFLMPGRESEEYPSYLAVRGTPVTSFNISGENENSVQVTDEEAREATESIRQVVLKDRALHDKSQIAFPSYVQAYRKHTARSIFRVAELPWIELAAGWGLLKLPRMPELKGLDIDPRLGLSIEWDNYAYRDKGRERKRKAQLEEKKTGGGGGGGGCSGGGERDGERGRDVERGKKRKQAWSSKKDAQEEREARREKRVKKREKDRESKMSEGERVKERELKNLIEQVRAQNVNGASRIGASQGGMREGDEVDFEGFD
ncbi:MAG: hypothetical protein Q9159_000378 [Coniocarpon cinnabarinum]